MRYNHPQHPRQKQTHQRHKKGQHPKPHDSLPWYLHDQIFPAHQNNLVVQPFTGDFDDDYDDVLNEKLSNDHKSTTDPTTMKQQDKMVETKDYHIMEKDSTFSDDSSTADTLKNSTIQNENQTQNERTSTLSKQQPQHTITRPIYNHNVYKNKDNDYLFTAKNKYNHEENDQQVATKILKQSLLQQQQQQQQQQNQKHETLSRKPFPTFEGSFCYPDEPCMSSTESIQVHSIPYTLPYKDATASTAKMEITLETCVYCMILLLSLLLLFIYFRYANKLLFNVFHPYRQGMENTSSYSCSLNPSRKRKSTSLLSTQGDTQITKVISQINPKKARTANNEEEINDIYLRNMGNDEMGKDTKVDDDEDKDKIPLLIDENMIVPAVATDPPTTPQYKTNQYQNMDTIGEDRFATPMKNELRKKIEFCNSENDTNIDNRIKPMITEDPFMFFSPASISSSYSSSTSSSSPSPVSKSALSNQNNVLDSLTTPSKNQSQNQSCSPIQTTITGNNNAIILQNSNQHHLFTNATPVPSTPQIFRAQVECLADAVSSTGLDRKTSLELANSSVLRRLDAHFRQMEQRQQRAQDNEMKRLNRRKTLALSKCRTSLLDVCCGANLSRCIGLSILSHLFVQNSVVVKMLSSWSSLSSFNNCYSFNSTDWMTLIKEQVCDCSSTKKVTGVTAWYESSSLEETSLHPYIDSVLGYISYYYPSQIMNQLTFTTCWVACACNWIAGLSFFFLCHTFMDKIYLPRLFHQILNVFVMLYLILPDHAIGYREDALFNHVLRSIMGVLFVHASLFCVGLWILHNIQMSEENLDINTIERYCYIGQKVTIILPMILALGLGVGFSAIPYLLNDISHLAYSMIYCVLY